MAALGWEWLCGSTTSWYFVEGLFVLDMYAHAEKVVRIQFQGDFSSDFAVILIFIFLTKCTEEERWVARRLQALRKRLFSLTLL